MNPPLKLLVVDDDPAITRLVDTYFSRHEFKVVVAHDVISMHRQLDREHIDVLLLDLGLPGEDGLSATRALRARWHGALIIITGRGESVERVVGLELGADDYVTKPFDLRELLARVRSVLRRTQPSGTAAVSVSPLAPGSANAYSFNGWTLDLHARNLTDNLGQAVELTTGEFRLLVLLLQSAGRVLSRAFLIAENYGREAGPFDRSIDVQIGRLRKKLRDNAEHPVLIKSVRGAGYLFAAPVQRR